MRSLELVLTSVPFLVALWTMGCSRGRDNGQIISEVQNRIAVDRRLPGARVQVRATDGIVTLSGYVERGDQRVATVQDATAVQGVKVVVDDLRVIDSSRPSPSVLMQPTVTPATRTAIRSAHLAIPKAEAPSSSLPLDSSLHSVQAEAINGGSSGAITASPSTAAAIIQATPDTHSSDAKTSHFESSISPVLQATPAPPAPPMPPEQAIVPYGTVLAVRMTETVSSDVSQKGDTFIGSLASPVMVGDRVVIPAEAGVQGKVLDVQSAGRLSGKPALAIELTRLAYNGKTYELHTSQYRKEGPSRDARTVAKIGGGAGVGAILGAILGGGKEAAIGAIIGAGAGTGAQAASRSAQVQIPAESMLSFRLTKPVTVEPSATLQGGHGSGPGSSQDPFSSDDRPVLKRRPGSPPADADAPGGSPSSDSGSPKEPITPPN